jgi:hypothetical protein
MGLSQRRDHGLAKRPEVIRCTAQLDARCAARHASVGVVVVVRGLLSGGGGPPGAVLPTMASRGYYVFLYTVRLAYPPCNSVIHVIAQGGDF